MKRGLLSFAGRILTLPPEISPSPRQPSAGRGLGRGASTGLQTWAAVAFRQGGLLSPALSSKGGGGGPGGGRGQVQKAPPGPESPLFFFQTLPIFGFSPEIQFILPPS